MKKKFSKDTEIENILKFIKENGSEKILRWLEINKKILIEKINNLDVSKYLVFNVDGTKKEGSVEVAIKPIPDVVDSRTGEKKFRK